MNINGIKHSKNKRIRIELGSRKQLLFMFLPLCIILGLIKLYNARKKRMIIMIRKLEKKDYVFDDIDNLVEYLFSKFGKLSPLKLQKGLYFLYAYYGATYGTAKQVDGDSEQDIAFPPKLFNETFEAWTYGPVVRSVYQKNREDQYQGHANYDEIPEINDVPDVRLFIDELFSQINSVSDFSLVDRSHEDNSWKIAYDEKKSSSIDNNSLIQEYREKYVR